LSRTIRPGGDEAVNGAGIGPGGDFLHGVIDGTHALPMTGSDHLGPSEQVGQQWFLPDNDASQ